MITILRLLLCFLFLGNGLHVYSQKDSTQLVTTWRTYNPGVSNDSSIQITLTNFSPNIYNFDIDWDNDGVFDSLNVTGTIVHQYPDTGTYTVRIRGQFPIASFGGNNVIGGNYLTDHEKVTSIDQWGTQSFLGIGFARCSNLRYNAVDVPNLTNVTNMSGMFMDATSFNGNINNWDVSNVLHMSFLFRGATSFDQPLDNWDVSSVINMREMFSFSSYNQPLNNWDVSSVRDMFRMFYNSTFNQPLNNWDVSSVTNMGFMFRGSSFNQPLNNWGVSSVTSMQAMFQNNQNFNQPLGNWDVSSVDNMIGMFNNAGSFDQSLGNWSVNSIVSMAQMLDFSNMSITNYDSTLIGWEAKPHPLNIPVGVINLEYCAAQSARSALVTDGWSFSGDTLGCSVVGAKEVDPKSKKKGFVIFPNPSSSNITILIDPLQLNEPYFIYDSRGGFVKESPLTEIKHKIDLSELPNGFYFIRVGAETEKLMVSSN